MTYSNKRFENFSRYIVSKIKILFSKILYYKYSRCDQTARVSEIYNTPVRNFAWKFPCSLLTCWITSLPQINSINNSVAYTEVKYSFFELNTLITY